MDCVWLELSGVDGLWQVCRPWKPAGNQEVQHGRHLQQLEGPLGQWAWSGGGFPGRKRNVRPQQRNRVHDVQEAGRCGDHWPDPGWKVSYRMENNFIMMPPFIMIVVCSCSCIQNTSPNDHFSSIFMADFSRACLLLMKIFLLLFGVL